MNVSTYGDKPLDAGHKVAVNTSIKFVSKVDYTLVFEIHVNGKVKTNDLMGAIYNHGNHVLEQLTLESLQNKRKLGRFEFNLTYNEQGTVGEFTVPLLCDKLEASIVAANLETVQKCGPFTQKIKLKEIVNERAASITKVLERAKYIYEAKFKTTPHTVGQLRTLLKSSTDTADNKPILLDIEANIYGGPYHSKQQIYLVEGLNDVKKLAQYNIYNTLSINGENFNLDSLKPLIEGKQLTILFDQDRGGKMLMEQISRNIAATYVVSLPEGQCVQSVSKDVLFEAIYKNRRLLSTTE